MDRPLDTLPKSLDALASAPGALDDFRITSSAEVLALLKQLADGNVLVNLNSSNGGVYTSTVWALDPDRGTLSFSADADDNQVQALVESEDAVAVAYLDSIKLQFDAHGLVLVRGGRASALNCAFPREVFRFQRRNGFRVRPLLRATPMARVRHPMIPDMSLQLRVLDVSIGGCALFLPDDVPPLQPGITINNVQIDLDVDTRITTTLRLQHVTSIQPDSRGVRLGCEMVNPSSDVLRGLQRYIDQTQKRQRMMSL
ncbi:flagellar brake protein [Rhizobacter sp. Root1221]|uniref:flagellar brake protein n=1 Tax=Rhizobacter sp. Root1221 TaxID=1736433 RepID=UPI001F1BCEE3|nr:flagellar brake protein [Rhizobacter sp. Root1221]